MSRCFDVKLRIAAFWQAHHRADANRRVASVVVVVLLHLCFVDTSAASKLRVLFLGDDGPHAPAARFAQLQPVLSDRQIELVYTDSVADLNAKTLAQYDALLLYANIDNIEPEQEQALLDYVDGGGGFVPIHCASYCFRNSPAIVNLIGAQFSRHGTGVFRTEIAEPEHAVMHGFEGFQSWDETYVHHRHNDLNRTVLSYRADDQGREPWTWVRTHGEGRVFYTAWGHDERTWGHAGFQNLIERGIRWAASDDPAVVAPYYVQRPFPVPKMTPKRQDVVPFDYVDVGAKIPNYVPSDKWGKQAEPKTNMQKPLPPEESLKHFVTPEGFHVELFASEPELGGKPIAMTWDERGRLIVCETYDYPNRLQPEGKGRDRIRICEDTDGDGTADKLTLFAEGLSIPTAILAVRGGFVVQSGTKTLFLEDTDGDGRADRRHVLIEGWNLRDTHGGVSNFHYGMDNWIWAMQGYNPSEPVINGRKQQPFRMGFFRFRLNRQNPPQVAELEFIRSTNNNTWGLGFSEEGLVFGSTANHNPSVFMPIANRYYERVRGWTKSLELGTIADTHLFRPITDKVRQVDHFGGYTAGAGHALYTARRYPREYWNRTAFVNGPTGHLVGTFVLTPQGSDFRSTSPSNLLASDDEWTAPIRSEVGPDGNVWVIDWYNYIVQHNPTPHGFQTGKGAAYETDLRDKKHGRIYRLVYGQKGATATASLADASTEQLVAALQHPNMLWRLHAQRLLVERGDKDVLPRLVDLVTDKHVDTIGLNVGAIHGLWTLHGLGLLDGSHASATKAAVEALQHPSAGVRRTAVQVLPHAEESALALLDCGVLNDVEAQVRLAVLLRLSELPPSPSAGRQIIETMSRPSNLTDHWNPDAATCAAANNSRSFLTAMCDAERPRQELIAMTTVVAEHFARGASEEDLVTLVQSMAETESQVAGALLLGFAQGWPSDLTLKDPAQLDRLIAEIFPRLSVADRGLLLQLATRWGSQTVDEYAERVRQSLLEELDDPSSKSETRRAAVTQLVAISPTDADTVSMVLARITPQTPPDEAVALLQALQHSESPELGRQLVAKFDQLTPKTRSTAIAVLLARPKWTLQLLEAAEEGAVQLSELSLDQQQALVQHPNRLVRAAAEGVLRRGGTLPDPDRQRVIDDLLPIASQRGDVGVGRAVFKKHCAKCHKHSGEGENIGPDLTGMAVHPKAELLTHILDPSRSVEGNFQTYTVVLADGRLRSGIVATESQTTIELVDAEGKRETLLREDVDELARSTKSLMPEGFEKQATRAELRDLLEFLTKRGRFLPLDIAKVATISSARGMFYSEDANVERLILDDWSARTIQGIPFQLIDPEGGRTRNVILMHSPNGDVSRRMPKSASLPCNGPVKAIHLLSGVSGWGFPAGRERTTSLIVRLHYADGIQEDHPLVNGEHFADYIRRVDVPGSQFAFLLRNQQMRYLSVAPKRTDNIEEIEFIKGNDRTAPIVMAVTVESPTGKANQ